jgi:DUF4097 and DUF4098 domain-containing protein YvlB
MTAATLVSPARAQDIVKVQVRIQEDMIRDIQREVLRLVNTTVIPNLDEIRQTITSAMAEVRRNIGTVEIVQRDQDYKFEQTHKETKTVRIGANGALDLRNISGNITVTGVSGNEATIEILRESRGRTEADAKLGLTEVTVQVDERGERASVQTVNPQHRERPPYRVAVNYTVKAPAGTRININTLSGDVMVTGIKGDTAVEVAGGDITVTGSRVSRIKTMGGDVTLTDVDAEGSLDVGTLGGDVIINRAKARRLAAETMGGDLTAHDVSADDASLKTMAGDVEFGGPLSKNGRYELRTHSGEVTFHVTGNTGFELEASTFSGTVRAGAELGLKPSSDSTRRSVRGTVGDGSARIIAVSLSGDVVITKK